MALTITQLNTTVQLKGALNAATLNEFSTHFKFILNTYENITLDINHLTELSIHGVQLLRNLYTKAIMNQNIFFIEGNRSEEIYEFFKYPQVA